MLPATKMCINTRTKAIFRALFHLAPEWKRCCVWYMQLAAVISQNIADFWDVRHNVFSQIGTSVLEELAVSMFIQNFSTYLPHYKLSYPTRLQPSHAPPWEPQTSYGRFLVVGGHFTFRVIFHSGKYSICRLLLSAQRGL